MKTLRQFVSEVYIRNRGGYSGEHERNFKASDLIARGRDHGRAGGKLEKKAAQTSDAGEKARLLHKAKRHKQASKVAHTVAGASAAHFLKGRGAELNDRAEREYKRYQKNRKVKG